MPRKFFILPILFILFTAGIFPYSYASPESEAEEDLYAGCRSEQTLVYRFAYLDHVCVEPSTAKRWVELGFAEIKQNSTSSTTMNESNPDTTYEEQYPGAPPPPPTKAPSETDSPCRDGQSLVYGFTHQDTFCTNQYTAITWERLGMAEIINSEEQVTEELLIDNSNDFLVATSVPKILPLDDGIWIAINYDKTATLLIEGESRIIVVDPLTSYDSAKKLLSDFKSISDKPVKTIIYTLDTPDILLGAKAFVQAGDGSMTIIAPEDFIPLYKDSANVEFLPTHTFTSIFSFNLSGVEMKLVFNRGNESSGQTLILLPDQDKFVISDSVYGVAPYIIQTDSLRELLQDDSIAEPTPGNH